MKPILLTAVAVLLAFGSLRASVIITNGLTHRHELRGSANEQGQILIKNVGTTPERIVIYLKDLLVDCENEDLNIAPPGTLPRSNYSFIRLGARERLLAPGEEFPLRYDISPSPDKKFIGSYWSLMMVEVQSPIDTNRLDKGVKVSSNIRYAIQIITDFSSDEEVEINFDDVAFNGNEEEKVLDVKLSNQSIKLVLPRLKLEIYDDKGDLIFEEKSAIKKLYPGQCRRFQVPVNDLPPGQFQAVLVADCGESDLFGMTINLAVDEE